MWFWLIAWILKKNLHRTENNLRLQRVRLVIIDTKVDLSMNQLDKIIIINRLEGLVISFDDLDE